MSASVENGDKVTMALVQTTREHLNFSGRAPTAMTNAVTPLRAARDFKHPTIFFMLYDSLQGS